MLATNILRLRGLGSLTRVSGAGLLALLAGAAPRPALAGEMVETTGTVSEVTVYRGQALVTREVKVPATSGIVELIITDLPERIVPTSIFAETRGGGVEVRSVRYRVRPVMEDVNTQVRALDAKIRELDDKLAASKRRGELLTEHRAYLVKLEGFVAPTATVELAKGVLNADTLKTLTELLRTQRAAGAEEELKLSLEQRGLSEQRELLQRERAQITGGSSRSVREAVVLVNLAGAPKNPSLAVRYLVDQAGWSPSYTIRADANRDHVQVEYYAAIQQMSGEDWGDVAMTLSTATPSLVSRAPELKPMTVALTGVEAQAQSSGKISYAEQKDDFTQKRRQVGQMRNAGVNAPSSKLGAVGGQRFDEVDQSLNMLANDEQLLDLLAREKVVRTAGAEPDKDGNLSVTYALTSRTSLPSRADRQQVQIAALSMPAEFYKVATPVLTEFVYDEAAAANTSSLVLLSGPAATYVEGRFVGSGEVPTVSTGEKFIVGLGIDSSLRASRELVEKSESIQGGNRVVDLVYRLGIENFGESAAKVRLLDRLPKAKESEVKLTLVEPGQPLSTEPGEVQNQKKNGVLRWDISAPGKAMGEKAWALEYKFRLEHDKQMTLAGVGK